MQNRLNKSKIVVIVGPTAIGKSSLAVTLAKIHNGEVVSADSRQVYKGLDIGTGKITKEEMEGVQHHLLDVADPRSQFTAADFRRLGQKAIVDIQSRGKLPIICGGTGMYVDSLIGNVLLPEVPPNPKLRSELSEKSAEELFTLLAELDPRRAGEIDKHNPRRLIRAIEIAKVLGKVPNLEPRLTGGQATTYNLQPTLWIGLNLPILVLKERIHKRLLARMEEGMVEEALHLHKKGLSFERMEVLGLEYRYLSRFLKKEISRDEMLRVLELEIVHYAKRQMVWFKRNKSIHWFTPSDIEDIQKATTNFIHA